LATRGQAGHRLTLGQGVGGGRPEQVRLGYASFVPRGYRFVASMWRVVLAGLFLASISHADDPESDSPEDRGVYAWLHGHPNAAIQEEATCASLGNRRCVSLQAEMREFQKLVGRGAQLSLDGVEKLAALDRNICEGQTSKTYREAAKKISAALCPRIRLAKARGDAEKVCGLASVALSASPLDTCVWSVFDEGGKTLAFVRERPNTSGWRDDASLRRFALDRYRSVACPKGPFDGIVGGEAPAELEPQFRAGTGSR
jgi:hypothetical protein